MRRSPHFQLPLVGGPLDGQRRRVRQAPQELPASIALPCRDDRRRNASPGDRDQLAVYHLKNDNGQWLYRHQLTASAAELGVEESRPDKPSWAELCPPFVRQVAR